MRALLLAAGLGTRLKPFTDNTPKCLIPIAGKPLLQIWLERLSDAGVDCFLINTHYLSEQVQAFITASPFKDRVQLVYEPALLGTAGTLIANLNFFQGQDGFLIHADNYCLADFNAFVQAHGDRPSNCELTMMTFRTDNPQSCGIVELNAQSIVTGFHEKIENPPGNLANGAVYLLSARLLQRMREDLAGVSDFSTEVLSHLVGKIQSYETTALFADIGTPETYIYINALANRV